jgi:hypothetical protein
LGYFKRPHRAPTDGRASMPMARRVSALIDTAPAPRYEKALRNPGPVTKFREVVHRTEPETSECASLMRPKAISTFRPTSRRSAPSSTRGVTSRPPGGGSDAEARASAGRGSRVRPTLRAIR